MMPMQYELVIQTQVTAIQAASMQPWYSNPLLAYHETHCERFKSHFHDISIQPVKPTEHVNALFKKLAKSQESPDLSILLRNYVRELWLSELPPQDAVQAATVKLVSNVAEGKETEFVNELRGLVPTMSNAQAAHWWTTIKNLFGTAAVLFNKEALRTTLVASPHLLLASGQAISVAIIKEIHGRAMSNLITTVGQFRCCHVSPLNSSVSYAPYQRIGDLLPLLVDVFNESLNKIKALENNAERLQRAIAAGAVFFSHLLWIHPFEDGNGRTARIALSFALRDFTSVPISLCLRIHSGDEYVSRVEWSHLHLDCLPYPVIDYVTRCAFHTHDKNLRLDGMAY